MVPGTGQVSGGSEHMWNTPYSALIMQQWAAFAPPLNAPFLSGVYRPIEWAVPVWAAKAKPPTPLYAMLPGAYCSRSAISLHALAESKDNSLTFYDVQSLYCRGE